MTYKIKPIKSESDYNNALAQIEILLPVSEHQDIQDKLEVISILVEDYENKHYQIKENKV